MITNELKIRVYHNKVLQSNSEIGVDQYYIVKLFSQISFIMEKYNSLNQLTSTNFNVYIEKAMSAVENALDVINSNEIEFKYTSQLSFINGQLKLIHSKKKKYTMDDFFMAMTIFMYSPSCYNVIRDNGFVILPHESTIYKLKAVQNIGANSVQSNENYFSNISSNLEEHEKIVIIQIDEIYLKTKCQYKAKNLTGYADNSNDLAKTMLSFMISSVFGPMKEIVKLIPVHNLTGKCIYNIPI